MKNELIISKPKLIIIGIFTAILLLYDIAQAQTFDADNRVEITLDDGTDVVLFGQMPSMAAVRAKKKSLEYYYLPVGLRLGSRPDGTPEFLFVKYITDKREQDGGISGGLMHFLMELGLSPEQKDELEKKLTRKIPGAKVMGAMPLEPDESQGGSFQIISATLSDSERTSQVVSSGHAPILEGGKVAAAAKLDKYGAQLLASTFERARSISDVTIDLNYTYQLQVTGLEAKMTIHWNKISTLVERASKREGNDYITITGNRRGIAINRRKGADVETHSLLDVFVENGYVTLDYNQTLNDERLDIMRETFFQALVNAFGAFESNSEATPSNSQSEAAIPDSVKNYVFHRRNIRMRSGKQVIDLGVIKLPVKYKHNVKGNLASWYAHVASNKDCVYGVNLNDPFFQHRDIRFILDLEAKEMFDKEINYVTVNVRKKRTTGNHYEDYITIDHEYIKNNGITAVTTYARNGDQNSSPYEYQMQWSLRGGNIYPLNPGWEEGSWEAITLNSPVTMRTLSVEADLEELKSKDIARITAQVRYMRFGQETETNIQVMPSTGEPLVSQKIFLDRDTNGYVYRLIINDKKGTKLVLPWQPRVNDDYVYAYIPKELSDEESDMFKMAKDAGDKLLKNTGEKILSKFEEILSKK